MEIRDRIRLIRQFKKLSTYALAKLTDMSQPVIDRMETGNRKICVEDIVVIANALNVPIEAFFYDQKMLEVMQGGKND